jgi:hypothetical protein
MTLSKASQRLLVLAEAQVCFAQPHQGNESWEAFAGLREGLEREFARSMEIESLGVQPGFHHAQDHQRCAMVILLGKLAGFPHDLDSFAPLA